MFEDFNMDNFLQELNDSINEEEQKDLNINFNQDVEDSKFINNDSQANYFCKLIANLQTEKQNKNEFIDNEIKRILNHYEEFRNQEARKLDQKIDFFKKALEVYAAEQLSGTKKKSIKLPYGTLGFKKQQDKYEYSDELILEWLKSNKQNDFITVKTTESIDKKKLKKDGFVNNGRLFINNIPVDGVSVSSQNDKFEIK